MYKTATWTSCANRAHLLRVSSSFDGCSKLPGAVRWCSVVPNSGFRTSVKYCRMGAGFIVVFVFGSFGPLPLSESKGPSAMVDYDAVERRGIESMRGELREGEGGR